MLTLLTSDKQMGHQSVYKRGLKQRCPSGWSVYPGRCNGYFAFPSHNGQEYPEFFCSNYNSPPYNGARFPNVSYKKNRFRASSVDRHSLAGPRKTTRAPFSSCFLSFLYAILKIRNSKSFNTPSPPPPRSSFSPIARAWNGIKVKNIGR